MEINSKFGWKKSNKMDKTRGSIGTDKQQAYDIIRVIPMWVMSFDSKQWKILCNSLFWFEITMINLAHNSSFDLR